MMGGAEVSGCRPVLVTFNKFVEVIIEFRTSRECYYFKSLNRERRYSVAWDS